MIGSELHYDDPGSTAAAVELLRWHDGQEPEANITSAVRDFLTATGLTKPEEIVEENPPSDSSRQVVDLTTLDTFLELKQRIGIHGNPHPDHVAQLDGYLKQSEDAPAGSEWGSSPTGSTGSCAGPRPVLSGQFRCTCSPWTLENAGSGSTSG